MTMCFGGDSAEWLSMSSTLRTQPVPATRQRRPGPVATTEMERRLEAFLLIARRVGLT